MPQNIQNVKSSLTDTTEKTRLAWALKLASRGFRVFPLRPNDKVPLPGFHWQTKATDDPEAIRAFFKDYPDCNYGVVPGEGYAILDLDMKHDSRGFTGLDHFGALELEQGIFPETFTVRTRSGGLHLFVKAKGRVGNANSFPNGIDVRGGASGYVVGPGCFVPVKKGERGNGHYLHEAGSLDSIAECPDWIYGYLKGTRAKDERRDQPLCELDLEHNIELAEKFLAGREPAVEGRNGDDWTYKTIAFLRDYGLSKDMAGVLIQASGWNRKCVPPWGADEMEDKLDNGFAHSQNRAGCKRAPISILRNIRKVIPLDPARYPEWRRERNVESGGGVSETVEGPKKDQPRRRFKLRSESEQDNQPDIEWLVPGVLQRETLALFFGPENSFKSFIALDLVLSAAAGKPWASYGGKENFGGYTPDRPLVVVYVAGEGARGIEKLRRPAWRKHHGITKPLPFYTVNEMPAFRSADDVESLIAEIRLAEISPNIVVIDTVARAALDLDENSSRDTGIFVAGCDRLKREFGCGVIAVHHSGKDGAKGARGSSNLAASFDARFRIAGDTDRLTARIQNEKQKDGEPWKDAILFEGKNICLDNGEHSLVFTRTAPGKSTKESDPRLEIALGIIAENKGKMAISMRAMARDMAIEYATKELTDGEWEKAAESMRNWLRKAVTGDLAKYAHRVGKSKNAAYEFEDRT